LVSLSGLVVEERETVGKIDGDGYPVFGVTNVDGITLTGVKRSADLSKYLRLKPHQFAYNPYRINVGSLGLSGAHQDGIVSPAYFVFAPKKHLDTAYLYYYLKSAEGNTQINYYGNRGSVRGALRFTDLCKMTIPLPPLSEQRRIVKIIDSIAQKIQDAQNLRHKARMEIEVTVSSFVAKVCFNGKYELVPFAEVLIGAKNGLYKPPFFWGRGIPCIRMYNIDGPTLNTNNLQSLDVTEEEYKTYACISGDLIFNRVNSAELVGKTGLIKEDYPKCTFESKNMRLRINPQKTIPEYAVIVLNSTVVKDYYRSVLKQQCGMATLNQNHVRNIPFPLPSLEEQRQIVKHLDDLQAKINKLKDLQNQTAAEFDALLPSVLDKAFKGNL
jgi:type I restriction enzyme S subunit